MKSRAAATAFDRTSIRDTRVNTDRANCGRDRACSTTSTVPPVRSGPVAELVDTVPASALAVYAHPDDSEVSCGGTVARWAAAGCDVHVVVCTRGDKGSSDPSVKPDQLAKRRAKEVSAAGKVLGVAGHDLLGHADGEIVNDLALRRELVTIIRRVRPEVVV